MSDVLPADVVEESLARRRADDEARGLPPHIDDPDTLDRIAAIITTPRSTENDTPTND
jgi:hypothetical protein